MTLDKHKKHKSIQTKNEVIACHKENHQLNFRFHGHRQLWTICMFPSALGSHQLIWLFDRLQRLRFKVHARAVQENGAIGDFLLKCCGASSGMERFFVTGWVVELIEIVFVLGSGWSLSANWFVRMGWQIQNFTFKLFQLVSASFDFFPC